MRSGTDDGLAAHNVAGTSAEARQGSSANHLGAQIQLVYHEGFADENGEGIEGPRQVRILL